MPERLFTSAQLVALAQAQGYDLNAALFRQWVSRGRFPKPRDTMKPGKVNVWYEQDARYLLTLCCLHEQNCRGDEVRLGLWLAGCADGIEGEALRPLLVEQLQLFHYRLTGSQSSGPQAYSEEELEGAINPRIERLIQESSVSTQVVWGVLPSLPEAYTRQVFTVPSHQNVPRTITQYMWPEPANERVRATYPHPQLTETALHAARLTAMQEYQLIDMLSCILGIPCAETAPHEANTPDQSGKPSQGYLYAAGKNLLTIPQAIAALQHASAIDLFFARGQFYDMLLDAIKKQEVYAEIEGYPSLDLPALLGPYRGDFTLLFASLKLLPLTAYGLAACLFWQDTSARIWLRPNLINVAIDHLVTRPPHEAVSTDALLATLFSVMIDPLPSRKNIAR